MVEFINSTRRFFNYIFHAISTMGCIWGMNRKSNARKVRIGIGRFLGNFDIDHASMGSMSIFLFVRYYQGALVDA